ncbi:helix-turn-helix transcriptional regulator [Mycobacterium nebraskense]|uniref:helix-turn-helix transcriptional regulator n=1 Tax=Mycobacterium nebraskense TaxID=244292 RepID=UPI0027E27CB6|nr:helix-turn-helix transcriptional regulator [Mycobacterium nebraskense]
MSSHGPSSPARGAMSRRVLRGFNPTEFVALRLRRGLTVSEVARLADVAHSTVHAWEAGTRTPQVDLLVRVMALLDAPIADVVTIEPEHCHQYAARDRTRRPGPH